jgi:hypothetical protein
MNETINEFLSFVDDDKRKFYEEIIQESIKLGFIPKKDKVKHLGISFFSKECKATVLRLIYDKKIELRLKFFASTIYSSVFEDSLRKTIERFNFRYTGCYGCGKCIDQKEGYIINYPNKVQYFRCGNELIEIIDMNNEISKEIVTMIKDQHKYYMEKNRRKLTTVST